MEQEMSFSQAVARVYRKFFTFSGRARRSEYWWFHLYAVLGYLALGIIELVFFGTNQTGEACGWGDIVTGAYAQAPSDEAAWCRTSDGQLSGLFWLVNFVPSLALASRRLHDIGRSFWWYLLVFLPVIGWIVLFIFSVTRGTIGDNRFGPDPVTTPEPADPTVV